MLRRLELVLDGLSHAGQYRSEWHLAVSAEILHGRQEDGVGEGNDDSDDIMKQHAIAHNDDQRPSFRHQASDDKALV